MAGSVVRVRVDWEENKRVNIAEMAVDRGEADRRKAVDNKQQHIKGTESKQETRRDKVVVPTEQRSWVFDYERVAKWKVLIFTSGQIEEHRRISDGWDKETAGNGFIKGGFFRGGTGSVVWLRGG